MLGCVPLSFVANNPPVCFIGVVWINLELLLIWRGLYREICFVLPYFCSVSKEYERHDILSFLFTFFELFRGLSEFFFWKVLVASLKTNLMQEIMK